MLTDPWKPQLNDHMLEVVRDPTPLAVAALQASIAYLGPQAASSDAVLTVAEKFHDWLETRTA